MIRLLGYRECEQVIFDTLRSNQHNTMTRNIEQQVSADIIRRVTDECYTPVELVMQMVTNAFERYDKEMHKSMDELFE